MPVNNFFFSKCGEIRSMKLAILALSGDGAKCGHHSHLDPLDRLHCLLPQPLANLVPLSGFMNLTLEVSYQRSQTGPATSCLASFT